MDSGNPDGATGRTAPAPIAEAHPASSMGRKRDPSRDTAILDATLEVLADVGYLGMDGTLPEARGRGAQSALLATRIAAAADQGLQHLFIETGERGTGVPDKSYRNILRAGFQEVEITRHWVGTR